MNKYRWAVVGAGPAGIAAVGKLLDYGILAHEIVWIDPKFTVGDFGSIWQNVPSNTKVDLFLKFLHSSDAFGYAACRENFALNGAPRDKTCNLRLMVEPLQWVTNQLKRRVCTLQDRVEHLAFVQQAWQLRLKQSQLCAKNVILAIGAEPKQFAFGPQEVIPLQHAMDPERIKYYCVPDDTIAVFGSSHSAVLVLRNLVESGVKQLVNFYRSPLCYAVFYDDWILYDDTGLKGPTAEWARQYLEGELADNLIRIHSNTENIKHYLPMCNKIVQAVGFVRRTLPVIEGWDGLNYSENTGVIRPGLFGFGIAFPEAKYNRLGMLEYRVGLWKFMDYLQRVMPGWLG